MHYHVHVFTWQISLQDSHCYIQIFYDTNYTIPEIIKSLINKFLLQIMLSSCQIRFDKEKKIKLSISPFLCEFINEDEKQSCLKILFETFYLGSIQPSAEPLCCQNYYIAHWIHKRKLAACPGPLHFQTVNVDVHHTIILH